MSTEADRRRLREAEEFWREPRRARLLQLRPDDLEALRILEEMDAEAKAKQDDAGDGEGGEQ